VARRQRRTARSHGAALAGASRRQVFSASRPQLSENERFGGQTARSLAVVARNAARKFERSGYDVPDMPSRRSRAAQDRAFAGGASTPKARPARVSPSPSTCADSTTKPSLTAARPFNGVGHRQAHACRRLGQHQDARTYRLSQGQAKRAPTKRCRFASSSRSRARRASRPATLLIRHSKTRRLDSRARLGRRRSAPALPASAEKGEKWVTSRITQQASCLRRQKARLRHAGFDWSRQAGRSEDHAPTARLVSAHSKHIAAHDAKRTRSVAAAPSRSSAPQRRARAPPRSRASKKPKSRVRSCPNDARRLATSKRPRPPSTASLMRRGGLGFRAARRASGFNTFARYALHGASGTMSLRHRGAATAASISRPLTRVTLLWTNPPVPRLLAWHQCSQRHG